MTWDELSSWQKSEVERRYRGYVTTISDYPPEIYIPVDPRRSPYDVSVITASDAPPNIPTVRKAVFRLMKYPNGTMDYKFTGIQ